MTDLHRHADEVTLSQRRREAYDEGYADGVRSGRAEEDRIWGFGYAAGYEDGFAAGRAAEERAMQAWAHAYNEREAAKATGESGNQGEGEDTGKDGTSGKYAPASNTFVQRQVGQHQAGYTQVGERRQAGTGAEASRQGRGARRARARQSSKSRERWIVVGGSG